MIYTNGDYYLFNLLSKNPIFALAVSHVLKNSSLGKKIGKNKETKNKERMNEWKREKEFMKEEKTNNDSGNGSF